MRVIDYERSEKGPQPKRDASGRRIHCCCICGRQDVWRDGWSTYCSLKEMDDCAPIPKFCSEGCRQRGGPEARNVTYEMKKATQDAEWRAPRMVYREATAQEKYNAALQEQRQKASDHH